MLRIQRLGPLAHLTGFTEESLLELAQSADSCVTKLLVCIPGKKDRDVIRVDGELRQFQKLFYKHFLKPKLTPSECSFGGIPGRHIVHNASQHLGRRYVYKTDIANFFPSIDKLRVLRLFLYCLKCSPIAAQVLTRLCTYEDHLALGLITSPILADQILKPVDQQIADLCEKRNLVYSRFVDDITVSGWSPILESNIPIKIGDIIKSFGFSEADKRCGGRLNGTQTITGLTAYNGKVDVAHDYLAELERRLIDHAQLGRGKEFEGPFFLRSQLRGQINHVIWINPNRRAKLLKLFSKVDWANCRKEARRRRIAVCKTIIRPREAVDYEI